jgi:hypothetical protein
MSVIDFEAPSPCPACGHAFVNPDTSFDRLPRCPGCQYVRLVGNDDLSCPNCHGWLYDAVLLRSDTDGALCGFCRTVLPPPPPEPVRKVPALPGPEEIARKDREFFSKLGEESRSEQCNDPDCTRGRIANGIYCRRHHFEMIRVKPCPFDD